MVRYRAPRTEFINTRYTPAELAAVTRTAERAGMRRSGWIRNVAVAATREPLPPGVVDLMAVQREQMREHRAVGVNLNQLVVALNSRHDLSAHGARGLARWAARLLVQLERSVGDLQDTNRLLRARLEEW